MVPRGPFASGRSARSSEDAIAVLPTARSPVSANVTAVFHIAIPSPIDGEATIGTTVPEIT